jgi:hypothetical protein
MVVAVGQVRGVVQSLFVCELTLNISKLAGGGGGGGGFLGEGGWGKFHLLLNLGGGGGGDPLLVWLLAGCCGCIDQTGATTGRRTKGTDVVW